MNNIHYTIENNNNYMLVKNNGSCLGILSLSNFFDIKNDYINYINNNNRITE